MISSAENLVCNEDSRASNADTRFSHEDCFVLTSLSSSLRNTISVLVICLRSDIFSSVPFHRFTKNSSGTSDSRSTTSCEFSITGSNSASKPMTSHLKTPKLSSPILSHETCRKPFEIGPLIFAEAVRFLCTAVSISSRWSATNIHLAFDFLTILILWICTMLVCISAFREQRRVMPSDENRFTCAGDTVSWNGTAGSGSFSSIPGTLISVWARHWRKTSINTRTEIFFKIILTGKDYAPFDFWFSIAPNRVPLRCESGKRLLRAL